MSEARASLLSTHSLTHSSPGSCYPVNSSTSTDIQAVCQAGGRSESRCGAVRLAVTGSLWRVTVPLIPPSRAPITGAGRPWTVTGHPSSPIGPLLWAAQLPRKTSFNSRFELSSHLFSPSFAATLKHLTTPACHTAALPSTRFTMRLSGLQKEVLALYRQCLRESRKKPQVRPADPNRRSCHCFVAASSWHAPGHQGVSTTYLIYS